MKRKSIYAAVFVFSFYFANAQTNSHFSSLKTGIQPISFKPIGDLTKITSLKMLGSIGLSEMPDGNYENRILPQKYDWSLEAFRVNSYKSMILNFQKQDRYGRDLPRNISQDMVNQIYFKDHNNGDYLH